MILFFLNVSKEKRDTEIRKFFSGRHQKLDREDLTDSALMFFAGGKSMFDEDSLYEGVYLFPDEQEKRDELIGLFYELEKSKNIFVFIEDYLSEEEKEKIRKITKLFFEGTVKEKEKVNPFLVVNKLSERDKLGSWLAFRKLLNKGEDPNGILGILFWAVKDGIKAIKGDKASRTGLLMKKNYKKDELLNQADEIIRLYHESKTGKENIVLGIEKFILENSNNKK